MLKNNMPITGKNSLEGFFDEKGVSVSTFKDAMDLKSLLDHLIYRRGRPSPSKSFSGTTAVKRCQSSLQPQLKNIQRFRNNMAHVLNNTLAETKEFLTSLHRVGTILNKDLGQHMAFENLCTKANYVQHAGVLLRKRSQVLDGRLNPPDVRIEVTVLKSSVTKDAVRLPDPLPQFLIGRNQLLQNLADMFTAPKTNESITLDPLRVLLHGPPGVGKTALAQALAYKLRSVFPKQYKFSAANTTSFSADIEFFCKNEELGNDERLGVHVGRKANIFSPCKRILFIIEDVFDPSLVWPQISSTKHCAIFTSPSDDLWTNNNIGSHLVHAVRVCPLRTEESLLLVKKIMTKEAHKRSIFNEVFMNGGLNQSKCLSSLLENEAGNLPLAVRLVAFQLASGQVSLDDISSELARAKCQSQVRSQNDIEAAGHVHVRGYFHLVRYALDTFLGSYQSEALCFCLSLLPPHGTPFVLVELIGLHLGIPRQDAIAALRKISNTGLIILTGGMVELHRVIQQHVRTALTDPTTRSSSVQAIYQALRRVAKGLLCDYISSKEEKEDDYSMCLKKLENQHAWLDVETAIESFLSFSDEFNLDWESCIDLSFCWLHWSVPFERSDWHDSCRKEIFAKITKTVCPRVDELFSARVSSDSISPTLWMAMLDIAPRKDWLPIAAFLINRCPRVTAAYIDHLNEFIRTLLARKLRKEACGLLVILGETVTGFVSLYHQTKNEKICTTLGLISDICRNLNAYDLQVSENALLSMISVSQSKLKEEGVVCYNVASAAFGLAASYAWLVQKHFESDPISSVVHCKKFRFWCEFTFRICGIEHGQKSRHELTWGLAFCTVELVLYTLPHCQPLMEESGFFKLWHSRLFVLADQSPLTTEKFFIFLPACLKAMECAFLLSDVQCFDYFAYTIKQMYNLAEKHPGDKVLQNNYPIFGVFSSWLKDDTPASISSAKKCLSWFASSITQKSRWNKVISGPTSHLTKEQVQHNIERWTHVFVGQTKKTRVFFESFLVHVLEIFTLCSEKPVLKLRQQTTTPTQLLPREELEDSGLNVLKKCTEVERFVSVFVSLFEIITLNMEHLGEEKASTSFCFIRDYLSKKSTVERLCHNIYNKKESSQELTV